MGVELLFGEDVPAVLLARVHGKLLVQVYMLLCDAAGPPRGRGVQWGRAAEGAGRPWDVNMGMDTHFAAKGDHGNGGEGCNAGRLSMGR